MALDGQSESAHGFVKCSECQGKGWKRGDECPLCDGTGDAYGRGPTQPMPEERDDA
jgi:DnaJ-class molecular chaperone